MFAVWRTPWVLTVTWQRSTSGQVWQVWTCRWPVWLGVCLQCDLLPGFWQWHGSVLPAGRCDRCQQVIDLFDLVFVCSVTYSLGSGSDMVAFYQRAGVTGVNSSLTCLTWCLSAAWCTPWVLAVTWQSSTSGQVWQVWTCHWPVWLGVCLQRDVLPGFWQWHGSILPASRCAVCGHVDDIWWGKFKRAFVLATFYLCF